MLVCSLQHVEYLLTQWGFLWNGRIGVRGYACFWLLECLKLYFHYDRLVKKDFMDSSIPGPIDIENCILGTDTAYREPRRWSVLVSLALSSPPRTGAGANRGVVSGSSSPGSGCMRSVKKVGRASYNKVAFWLVGCESQCNNSVPT